MNFKSFIVASITITAFHCVTSTALAQEFQHFDPKGKPPSAHTLKIFEEARGFDLANITFIEGKTGWIVFDP